MEDDKLKQWQKHWLKMSVEKQFDTAVSIIKNLPKDGKYHFSITVDKEILPLSSSRSLSTVQRNDAEVLWVLQTSYARTMQ